MTDRSLSSTIMLILLTIAAVGGGLYFYNHFIEPQQDGPLERAGEKLDHAIGDK